MMTTNEQLLYFCLSGKLRLSNYDYRFLSNLLTMTRDHARVTGNQASLYDKLMLKYGKQLANLGIDQAAIQNLSWKVPVVESTEDYTSAKVRLTEDTIAIRVPYNKAFINAFKLVKDSRFAWINESKEYRASFNTASLKLAIDIVGRHFEKIQYCDQISAIMMQMSQYDAKYWTPTLTMVGNMPVVMACSSALASAIDNIPISADPKTYHMLSQFGIAIDPLLTDDPFSKFAASRTPEVEITNLETVFDWMKNLGCDTAIVGRGLTYHASADSLVKSLNRRSINTHLSQAGPTVNVEAAASLMCIQHVSSMRFLSASVTPTKIIIVKDSRPIEAK